MPFARLLVPISGGMAIVGGLSLLAGFHATWGAWVLIAFLVPVTAMMHQFWDAAEPASPALAWLLTGASIDAPGTVTAWNPNGNGLVSAPTISGGTIHAAGSVTRETDPRSGAAAYCFSTTTRPSLVKTRYLPPSLQVAT